MAKVLIVDDEPDILLMLRLTLESEGYDTVLAADGEQGLTRIREDEPDIVILDVMMPVRDGWGVLGSLDSDTGPPVIILSAKSAKADRERAFTLGATEYMTKPFDPDGVIERVAEILAWSPERRAEHRAEMLAAATADDDD